MLIRRVLEENGEPYISTRELVFFEDAKRLGKSPQGYYYAKGILRPTDIN